MARLCSELNPLFTEDVLKRLNKIKITTVLDFLQENPEKIVKFSNICFKDILQIRSYIVSNYAAFPSKGLDVYNDLLLNSAIISTGIASLDSLLDGGLLTGNIYEVCGFSSAGKTQLCLSIAVHASSVLKQNVHYIDSSLQFSAKRVKEILKSRKIEEEEVSTAMDRISVTRVDDVYQVFSLLHNIKENVSVDIEDSVPLRLIILDSLPPLFYSFLGEMHNEGLGLMNHFAGLLKYLCTENHLVLVLVNLALRSFEDEAPSFDTTVTNESFSEKNEVTKPALGKYWVHIPNTRILLEKHDTEITANVVKSTTISCGKCCKMTVSNYGIT